VNGDEVTGMRLYEETLFAGFHGNNGDFVAVYLRNGQRMVATLLAAGLFPAASQAPVNEWIKTLENPAGDHREGLARFDRWSEESGFAFDVYPPILVAFEAYDRIDTGADEVVDDFFWTPESAKYRQSEQFRNTIRERGILRYWQTAGFPPQCEPVGESFRCD